MDVDPTNLDPELRTAKFLALASAALGVLSLCMAIVPVCGGTMSILGIALGLYSLRVENSGMAKAGVIISGLGILITVVYMLFVFFFRQS
jgi:hypothetical protein